MSGGNHFYFRWLLTTEKLLKDAVIMILLQSKLKRLFLNNQARISVLCFFFYDNFFLFLLVLYWSDCFLFKIYVWTINLMFKHFYFYNLYFCCEILLNIFLDLQKKSNHFTNTLNFLEFMAKCWLWMYCKKKKTLNGNLPVRFY